MFKMLASGVLISILSLYIPAQAYANDTGIASMLHSMRGERGQVCMVGHYHIGKSPRAYSSRKQALKAAVRHWVSFTAAEYGSDWGSYNRAASRNADCEKVSSSAWACKVKARPCRKGLSVARR